MKGVHANSSRVNARTQFRSRVTQIVAMIFWVCESCNPKTRQGVKRLLQSLVGRAHKWRDCGRKVEKEHICCMCGNLFRLALRESSGCLPLERQWKSWMWDLHRTGGSINTLQKKTKTEQDLYVTHHLILLPYRFSCSASICYCFSKFNYN